MTLFHMILSLMLIPTLVFANDSGKGHATKKTPAHINDLQIPKPSAEEMKLNCESLTIEVPDLLGRQDQIVKVQGCTNKYRTRLASPNCIQKCVIDELAQKVKKPIAYQGQGTPGALLCEKMGGHSEIVFMTTADGVRSKIDRCVYKDQFVSLGYLYSRWVDFK